jgi:hypothetical protein
MFFRKYRRSDSPNVSKPSSLWQGQMKHNQAFHDTILNKEL